MNSIELLGQMIDGSSRLLSNTVEGVPEDKLGQRPGQHLNPVGFIYWHVLRHWDRDVNVLSRGQELEADAWHRGGFADEFDYHPVGLGLRGLGTGIGYTDAEVDAVPFNFDALQRYQQMLYVETEDYLGKLDEATLDRETSSPYLPGVTYTISDRLQHLIMHTCQHIGDIAYVKGAIGITDPTYPGS